MASTSGCASAGRIAEYDFRDQTVGVVAVIPPQPYVDSGQETDLTGLNVLEAAIKVGTGIYKESQASKLRPRLDSASTQIDLADRISGRVLDRAARILGARPVEDAREADFTVEVQVEEYGVEAPEFDDGARFRIEARILLLDREGREVWKGKVSEDEPFASSGLGIGTPGNDVVTGRALGQLTVPEIVDAFEAIADYSADKLVEKLRQGTEKARS